MKNLEQRLEQIDMQFLAMVKNVERFLEINILVLTSQKFNTNNISISKNIEDNINQLDLSIREDSIITMARFQPAAYHLRKLVMITDSSRLLERMGDLLKANLILINSILEQLPPNLFEQLIPLTLKIKHIFSLYIKGVIDKDTILLYSLIELDLEIDLIVNNNFKFYINYMQENPSLIEIVSTLLFINKKFERFSDHIIHLTKDSIYAIDGNNLRKEELLKNID